MNRYLNEFFSLRCAGDILNVTGSIHNGPKEITEAMSVRRILKDFSLQEKMTYHVLDLCAGNGLLGLLTAFTLPVLSVTSIDIRPRKLNTSGVRNYSYQIKDLMRDEIEIKPPTIICAIHACRELAERSIELYLTNGSAKKLVLMPCCSLKHYQRPTSQPWILERVPKSVQWVWYLAEKAGGVFHEDKSVLSPMNKIIIAEKD